MKRWRTMLLLVLLGPIIALEVWLFLVPNKFDARGARYAGWRLGLPTLSAQEALSPMVNDRHREDLVVGKTKDELVARFGFVSSAADANPNAKHCYQNSPWRGHNVLFLRQSDWMVVMKDGHAVELYLAKGC